MTKKNKSTASLSHQDARNEEPQKCFIILIDALDEAAFHRNDGGESIGWLLRKTADEFPPGLRFVVTSTSGVQQLQGSSTTATLRTIRIDDVELDERIQRDTRIFVDYHLAINPKVKKLFGNLN